MVVQCLRRKPQLGVGVVPRPEIPPTFSFPPYAQYLELVLMLEADDLFRRWHDGKQTVAKAKAAPISLLVLTALQYLGHGWTAI
jgi:hypothetical protein